MFNNYLTPTIDSSGNTHFVVQLRQNLRWQDGAVLDSKDIKFSLLNFRDQAPVLGYGAANVVDVKIISPTTLDIIMRGQSPFHLTNLATVPIIPRHLWQLAGDTTYGDTSAVDPAKLDPSFDPLANDLLIGSGPYACVSIFPEDAGRIGTGCLADDMDNRSGQTLFSEGTLTLQQFDFTGQPNTSDPFLQYMRSSNQGWGTGSGAHAESGQFQEFSWADRYDNATVNIRDLASVASCFGKSGSAGCLDYSYWLRSAFHPGSPATIGAEVVIVASHLDDTWVYPFSWNGVQSQQPGQTLQNIVAFTP